MRSPFATTLSEVGFRILPAYCARAITGHAAAQLSRVMNSRHPRSLPREPQDRAAMREFA
jgi:hypothetical protein